jgi:hypothetical protein
MLSKLVTSMAAAALVAAPLAAQAAPVRVAAPSAEGEDLRGGFVLPAIIGIGLLIVLWLAIDSEEDLDVPFSP